MKIDELYGNYEKTVLGDSPSPLRKAEAKAAFYAGSFTSIMMLLNKSQEGDPKELERFMSELLEDIKGFLEPGTLEA